MTQSRCDGCVQVEMVEGYRLENARLLAQLEELSAAAASLRARTPRLVEFRGERKTVGQWSRVVGLPADTLALRLRRGWSVERAMTTKIQSPCRSLDKKGVP